jgi:hypothetical protein
MGLLMGLSLASSLTLAAAPAPHPDRPDRLVEARDGFTVEYSPGQEAWMEMAFVEMRAEAAKPIPPPGPTVARAPGPAVPGSAQYLQENREVILAAIARQTGLPQPTALHGRVFDTFLGYYRLTSELMLNASREMPPSLTARHLAIWQRDDLVARLRSGAKIEGMTYDPSTDSGNFGFNFNVDGGLLGTRLGEIKADIEAQKVRHQLNFSHGTYAASFTLGKGPDVRKEPEKKSRTSPGDFAALISNLVFPIIYRGDAATAPDQETFDYLPRSLAAARETLGRQAAAYRDPNLVAIILHETAEAGLIENLIRSADRRWLCDGTANYVAWRVTRDLTGPGFAQQVYPLDAQLRRHAVQQPKVDLAAWPAIENQKDEEAGTDLDLAHYAFATRAMFLIAERHGENALAQLWADVGHTPRKKVTAKTFANAYRKRFKADLRKLVIDAQNSPIPVIPPDQNPPPEQPG